MLLHGQRVVGSAFDGGVIGDDHAFVPGNDAYAGDDSSARHFIVVHPVRRKWAQFEKRSRRVDQALDAFAREQLAAFVMAVDVLFAAAQGHPVQAFAKILGKGAVRIAVRLKLRVAEIHAGRQFGGIVPVHRAVAYRSCSYAGKR